MRERRTSGRSTTEEVRRMCTHKPVFAARSASALGERYLTYISKRKPLLAADQVGGVYSVPLSTTSELYESQGIEHVIMVR